MELVRQPINRSIIEPQQPPGGQLLWRESTTKAWREPVSAQAKKGKIIATQHGELQFYADEPPDEQQKFPPPELYWDLIVK